MVALLLVAACGRPPAVKLASAVELSPLQASPHIVGRDGAYSVQAWGNEVWTFGDTFLANPNSDGFNFVSNTFATSAGAAGVPLMLTDRLDDAGAPDELLRPSRSELDFDLAHRQLVDGGCDAGPCGGRWATWPGASIFDPADGGSVLTFYGEISAAPGDFNFFGVGQGIAIWKDFAALPTRPALNLCDGQPLLLFCKDEPGFGAAAVALDGDIYAFACDPSGASVPCKLGRVPFASALDKSAWEYWTGNSWSPELSRIGTVFDGATILGVFFEPADAVWMTIYARPLSNQVVYRTAPELTGPWTEAADLFVPDRGDGGGGTYDALPHPELAEQNGKVQFVTYSRSRGGNPFASEFALYKVTFQ